ncbi:MAG: hypothetical protein V4579_03390 [Pseudomonadota bacterium]
MGRGLIIAIMCCLLAGCGRSDGKAPTGQVVATVNGQEITAAELNMELGDPGDDPQAYAARRKAMIRALVARKLLVAEAQARELNTTAQGMFARNRARDLALVDLLRRDLAGGQDFSPSDSEVDRYVDSHASTFNRRELISADQIIVRRLNSDVTNHLRTLASLDAVNAYLAAQAIPATSFPVVLDSLYLAPETASAISRAGANALVIAQESDDSMRILQITDRRSAMLDGEPARLAARMLLIRNAGEGTRARLEEIIRNGRGRVDIAPAKGS